MDGEDKKAKEAVDSTQWLLRMFESPAFELWMMISWISKNAEQTGVQDFLFNRLYAFAVHEWENFIPQICNLFLFHIKNTSTCERFLIDNVERNIHLALRAFMIFDSAVADRFPAVQQRASKMRQKIETCAVNSKGLSSQILAGMALANSSSASDKPLHHLISPRSAASLSPSPSSIPYSSSSPSLAEEESPSLGIVKSNSSDLSSPVYSPSVPLPPSSSAASNGDGKQSSPSASADVSHGSIPRSISLPDLADLIVSNASIGIGNSKERIANFFNDQIHFLTNLTQLSDRMRLFADSDIRLNQLKRGLRELNKSLPPFCYIPLCDSSDRFHRVVALRCEETAVMKSREKAPYLLMLEVLEGSSSCADALSSLHESFFDADADNRILSDEGVLLLTSSGLVPASPASHKLRMDGKSKLEAGASPTPYSGSDLAAITHNCLNEEPMKRKMSEREYIRRNRIKEGSCSSSSFSSSPVSPKSPSPSSPDVLQVRIDLKVANQGHVSHSESISIPSDLSNSSPLSSASSSCSSPSSSSAASFLSSPSSIPHLSSPPIYAANAYMTPSPSHHSAAAAAAAHSPSSPVSDANLPVPLPPMPLPYVLPSPAMLSGQSSLPTFRPSIDLLATVFKQPWSERVNSIRSSSPHGHSPNWRLLSVIVKHGDDLRQEELAIQIIRECKSIFDAEKDLPIYLRPYRILATSQRSGLIETVPDALSLDSVKKRTPGFTTLRDYFIRAYGEPSTESFQKAQRCFAESMAGYSIVTHLLSVRDRHNGNILIDRHGHIIHIDFGFMLGNSPGGVTFERAPFKLSSEFVEVLDGPQGKAFAYFEDLLLRGFTVLCKNSERILSLLQLMLPGYHLPCIASGVGEQILEEMTDRLKISMTDEERKKFVKDLVQQALGSWSTYYYEKFQWWQNGIL